MIFKRSKFENLQFFSFRLLFYFNRINVSSWKFTSFIQILKKIFTYKRKKHQYYSFKKIKRNYFVQHKKIGLGIKLIVRTLQIKLQIISFTSFYQIRKISEYNKKQTLPRIQVIRTSEKFIDSDTNLFFNDYCKEIDKSIIYNQVSTFFNIFIFFSFLIRGLCG